jgi:hypothetical protein
MKATGAVNSASYSDIHQQIADELSDAADTSGPYLQPYFDLIGRYKRAMPPIQAAIERCRVTLACRNAGGG